MIQAQPLQDIQPPRGVVPGSNVLNHLHKITSPKKLAKLGKKVEEINLSKSIAVFHKEKEPLEKVSLLESFAIFHEEKEPLEEVNLSDSLAILYVNYVHYVVDKSSEDKIRDFNVEIIDCADFLGIDNILFNFHNNDGFGAVGNNYMFKREVSTDPFLGIFMACGKEMGREKYGKSKVLPSSVWG
jgi:hypothetical protein